MWLLLRGSDLAVTAQVKPRSWWCPSKQTSPYIDHSLGRECWLAESDGDIWVLAQPLVSGRCVLLGKDFSIHFCVFTPCQQAPSLSLSTCGSCPAPSQASARCLPPPCSIHLPALQGPPKLSVSVLSPPDQLFALGADSKGTSPGTTHLA